MRHRSHPNRGKRHGAMGFRPRRLGFLHAQAERSCAQYAFVCVHGLFAAGGNGGGSHMPSKNSLNDMPKPFTILSLSLIHI